MKRTGLVLVLSLVAATVAVAAGRQVSLVTDKATGRSVILESKDGKTIVTDIESGESIVVAGMLAGAISDDDYTHMMGVKRLAKQARSASADQPKQELGEAGVTAWANFSVSGGTSGKNYPSYPLSKGTVSVKIYGVSSRPGGDIVRVTLYREVPFWYDKSFDAKDYSVDKFGKTSTKSWTADKDARYYLHITRTLSGSYTAYGTYTITG
jgi:hypothetical protein